MYVPIYLLYYLPSCAGSLAVLEDSGLGLGPGTGTSGGRVRTFTPFGWGKKES